MTTGELAQKLSEFPPDVELAFEEVWRPHHGLALANITLGHGEKLVLFFKPKSIINQPTNNQGET